MGRWNLRRLPAAPGLPAAQPCEAGTGLTPLEAWPNRDPGRPHNLRPPPTTSKDLRLIYEVQDHALLVFVVAVGKRERNAVYRQADQR
jgi:hypothetical protein